MEADDEEEATTDENFWCQLCKTHSPARCHCIPTGETEPDMTYASDPDDSI